MLFRMNSFNGIALDDDIFEKSNKKKKKAILPAPKLGPLCDSLKDNCLRSLGFCCSSPNKDV